jgi:hypothetical protein
VAAEAGTGVKILKKTRYDRPRSANIHVTSPSKYYGVQPRKGSFVSHGINHNEEPMQHIYNNFASNLPFSTPGKSRDQRNFLKSAKKLDSDLKYWKINEIDINRQSLNPERENLNLDIY